MPEFVEISQVIGGFLSLCGGITIAGGAIALVFKGVAPILNAFKRIEALERNQSRDYERLQRLELADKAICAALLAILDRLETGNSTGTIKSARQDLQNWLIGKR
jgi:hypothetical protein